MRRRSSEEKQKYKLGARRLEKIIDQVYGVHIPHNRIHRYLEEGLAGEESRKRRKPYVMYEREYSMSAGHIVVWLRQHTAFTILDASRKVLAVGEFWHLTRTTA